MPNTHPARETARHRRAFELWYAADRNFATACQRWQTEEGTRLPDRTLRHWAASWGWADRADERDAEAEAKAHREAVARKAKMLTRHADIGRALTNKAATFYADKETKITKISEALAAIRLGIEIERGAEDLPTWLVGILGKTDDELIREYGRIVAQIGGIDGGDEAARSQSADADDGEEDEEGPEAED